MLNCVASVEKQLPHSSLLNPSCCTNVASVESRLKKCVECTFLVLRVKLIINSKYLAELIILNMNSGKITTNGLCNKNSVAISYLN